MEFNDGSQYQVLTSVAAYSKERDFYEFRAASARGGRLYKDEAFDRHREMAAGLKGLLMYQFVYSQWSPEEQANFLCNLISDLRPNEMVMLDIEVESRISNPANFAIRWLSVVEERLDTLAWIYVPGPLANQLTPAVTGNRIVKAPRYSGGLTRGKAPSWHYDVHQYSDCGYFPGSSGGTGDVNWTTLSTEQLLERCDTDMNQSDRNMLIEIAASTEAIRKTLADTIHSWVEGSSVALSPRDMMAAIDAHVFSLGELANTWYSRFQNQQQQIDDLHAKVTELHGKADQVLGLLQPRK